MPKVDFKLDNTDRQLLDALQKDGRTTIGELAERVSLSQSPCWRRVRNLEECGVIAGYHARLDRRLLGYGMLGLVHMACTITRQIWQRPLNGKWSHFLRCWFATTCRAAMTINWNW